MWDPTSIQNLKGIPLIMRLLKNLLKFTMKKLSRPLTELKFKYDVIVVGSGYGGSIAASRMSRCGRKVCLLEKGKEFLPGQFPRTLSEASREMQFNKGKL